MFAQIGPATALPEARTRASIKLCKKVFIGRIAMVVKRQIDPTSVGDDVAGTKAAYGDVVNKARANVETRHEIIGAAKGYTVVAIALLFVGRAA